MFRHTQKDGEDISTFYYIPNFLDNIEQNELKRYLDKMDDFIPSFKYNNGISRLQKWFHIEKKYFCPDWKVKYPQWTSFEMDNTIKSLIKKVQDYVNNISDIKIPLINSCLINKYPKGENFIAPHRDSELSFGKYPTIIGLSIGETRSIDFIHNYDKHNNFSFELESGSIFIMAGSSQECFKHTISKKITENVRYSLTFRECIA